MKDIRYVRTSSGTTELITLAGTVDIDDLADGDKEVKQVLDQILKLVQQLGSRGSMDEILFALFCTGTPVMIDRGKPVLEFLRNKFPGKRKNRINTRAAARAAINEYERTHPPLIIEFTIVIGEPTDNENTGPP